MSKLSKIYLYDDEGQELASFNLEDKEAAFNYAEKLEEMGISVNLKEPSLPESLISSLGASNSDREQLRREIDEEIDSHDTPSCGTIKKAEVGLNDSKHPEILH